MADAEVTKLQNHLKLLREEYVKLQSKLADVERKYQVAAASAGQAKEDNFVSRLLKTVADLFDKELYSDLHVQLDGQSIKAHRFVLAARSVFWGVTDLSKVSELDLSGIPYEVGHALLKWVYTDQVDMKKDDIFILDLMKAASKFRLGPLRDRCEKALMSSVHVGNCIRYYETADEIGAEILKSHCSELISNHWNDFTSEDFAQMTAPLLYNMFKQKTEYPLHQAIRANREDVVFLYLIEYDAELPGKLNEIDNRGDIPMDLALQGKQESIAETLISHRVDVNRTDNAGRCLLHKALERADEFSSSFLIKNKCNVNAATNLDKETALHLVASFNPEMTDADTVQGMARIAQQLLDGHANANVQDSEGNTPLHRAIRSKNEAVFSILLSHSDLNLELQTSDGETALWLALQTAGTSGEDQSPDSFYSDQSFAVRLIKRGSSPDAINPETGDMLLHRAARAGNEVAALFLASHGAKVNHINHKGESPLHTACQKGLARLTETLLLKGSNPNVQTRASLDGPATPASCFEEEDEAPIIQQTPLHVAISNRHEECVKVYLNHKARSSQSGDNTMIIPNFSLKDSCEQTPFGLALWNGFHGIAIQLLTGGAGVINDKSSDGMTLLHQGIMKQDTPSALFLLEHQADINIKTRDNETPLQLAIKRHLPVVVDALCSRGANMNMISERGDCPLWQALETGQEDIASTLVRHGCDATMWGPGPEGCIQTLLHRAIDENNEAVGTFLIRSGCDVNSIRKLGPNGEGVDVVKDKQGPLHMASSWGMEGIVQALVEHNADVNIQDADGNSPLHIAIINQHPVIIALLMSHPALNLNIRDKHGMTPFATAMTTKNNKAAQSILDREPTAAEQVDNKGRNFLHIAIQKSDIESVLFLISIHANVNSRVQDAQQLTPLHLAVQAGSEIIVRNLLLAGAHVNDLMAQKQNALHIAAEHDQSTIASVLLENGTDFDAVDDAENNALHIAVQHGNINTVRVLLTESRINAEGFNMRGQTPMHILGQYGKENAAAIFELFKESMPEYPIDRQDAEGNNVLLLAYINGNANLCRAVVRAGGSLGCVNKNGFSIFNFPVPTKQLLFKLLDMLSKEPPWSEGEACLECAIKFSIKTRRHHCRHCGRLLCSKCSDKDMPIVKFNQAKPVRVCEMCFDVLSLGAL
ncbi:rabankyrin-5-like isoform X2 [Lineus longissimus]|uniref:rabankyrin-5-like isoform X2 n=1 Tax=Lineus longissimus TaxID=88925 RepID=UPI00315C524A